MQSFLDASWQKRVSLSYGTHIKSFKDDNQNSKQGGEIFIHIYIYILISW